MNLVPSSLIPNINNAGVVGDSYAPTTFDNMLAGEKISEDIPNEFASPPVEESGDEYVEDDNSDHIPSNLAISYHPGHKGLYHLE